MADYLTVRTSDDIIVSWSDSPITEPATRLVDVAAQSITGDALPADKANMSGGTLTSGFVYAAPTLVDWTDRNRASAAALEDWLTAGTMTDDLRWKRCIKSNALMNMEEADWVLLVAAYPA
jgi:hypothetical protein